MKKKTQYPPTSRRWFHRLLNRADVRVDDFPRSKAAAETENEHELNSTMATTDDVSPCKRVLTKPKAG